MKICGKVLVWNIDSSVMQNFLNCKQVLDWAHRPVSHRVPGTAPNLDANSTLPKGR